MQNDKNGVFHTHKQEKNTHSPHRSPFCWANRAEWGGDGFYNASRGMFQYKNAKFPSHIDPSADRERPKGRTDLRKGGAPFGPKEASKSGNLQRSSPREPEKKVSCQDIATSSHQTNYQSANPLSKLKALDLFSGTGSVGNRLRELGYEVVSLDIDTNRKPDIAQDVLSWDYAKDFPKGYFHIIAAGVPCNEYSTAKTIGERNLEHADKLVEKTMEIINFFKPPMWWVENPRLGQLKTREMLKRYLT